MFLFVSLLPNILFCEIKCSYAEFVLSMSNGNIVADNSSMVTSSQSPRGEQCPKHTLTFFFTSIFGLLIPPHSNTSAKVSPATGRSKSVGKLSTNKSKSQSFSKKTNRGISISILFTLFIVIVLFNYIRNGGVYCFASSTQFFETDYFRIYFICLKFCL